MLLQATGIFGFLSFGWADLLDILMVAVIIFLLIRSIRGDSTILNIVLVLVFILILQAVVSALNMRMMTVLLNTLLDVGVLAIIILFQPEIRHLLNRLAVQSGISRRGGQIFNRLLGIKEEKMGSQSVEELGEAVRAMSAEKTGALIVLQHKSTLEEYMETGDRFEADINRRLIVNIFFKSSGLDWIVTFVGILIFTGLTMYDAQKVRAIAAQERSLDNETVAKLGLLGALELYLDFINLFLYILRLLGKRK